MPFQDLRGGQLRSAPVSVDFNGQRWTFGQGLDGAIWMQIGEQTEWTCPRFDDIQDVEITSAAPAVAVLDHRIILVWRGSGGDRHLYYRLGTIDGRWGPRVRVTEQARTIDAPTVVVESRGLTASVHLVFRGEDEAIAHHEGEIDINRGGAEGTIQQQIAWRGLPQRVGPRGSGSPLAPAAAMDGGQLVVAHTGRDWRVYENRFARGGWGGWRRIGDGLTTEPPYLFRDNTGQLTLLVVGSENRNDPATPNGGRVWFARRGAQGNWIFDAIPDRVTPQQFYVVASRVTAAVIRSAIYLFALNVNRHNGRAVEFRRSNEL
jgi:hypothetical protein